MLCVARGLHSIFASTGEHVPLAASPAAAEAAAVNFITLEARLGDAPAPTSASALAAPQYTVVHTLRWRGRQLLGLLATGLPKPSPNPQPEHVAPAAAASQEGGRPALSTASPGAPRGSGSGTGSGTGFGAGSPAAVGEASRGIGPSEARALEWVEAGDFVANCSSLLLHQVPVQKPLRSPSVLKSTKSFLMLLC